MNQGKICISICAETATELFEKIRLAEQRADVIEIRFDCLEPMQIGIVLDGLPQTAKQFLLTFRPASQGGRREIDPVERTAFWNTAVERFKEQNIIFDQEFSWRWPENRPDEMTVVSLHDFGTPRSDLEIFYAELSKLDCLALKLAQTADDAIDAIPLWKLLERAVAESRNLIPIAMGEAGKWTRILGLAHGAYMTYAALDEGSVTAPGQITAKDMIEVFGVKDLNRNTEVYGIIAGDTSYSMSPFIHNPAFRAAGMNRVFVPLQVKDVAEFIRRMVRLETREFDLNFRGFSVTNPHKQAIIAYLDEIDDMATAIGAVNTVRIDGQKLVGFNTDAPGFILPLTQKFGDIKGARVALFGAGGAARACIYAMKEAGAEVTVFARDETRAKKLAEAFGCRSSSLPATRQSLQADILVNATPVGTKGRFESEAIVKGDQMKGVKLVYDLIYNPEETLLIREGRASGCETLGGLDMLIGQAVRQFEIWTGHAPSLDVMLSAARKRLSK